MSASGDRWVRALEAAEAETGLAYHHAGCDCEMCAALEAMAERIMEDQMVAEWGGD